MHVNNSMCQENKQGFEKEITNLHSEVHLLDLTKN